MSVKKKERRKGKGGKRKEGRMKKYMGDGKRDKKGKKGKEE